MNKWSFGALKRLFSKNSGKKADPAEETGSGRPVDPGHEDCFPAAETPDTPNEKGCTPMTTADTDYESCDIANIIPHCPVILALDTSHSMWGQGLADLKRSLNEFGRIMCRETFPDALIDIETIRIGENFGVLEAFTPVRDSILTGMEIRPKGDTPLGASLELALAELKKQLAVYRARGINCVQPQMIVLSDGRSSDDFSRPAQEIREMVREGRLICRAIALGSNPDCAALRAFAGDEVVANAETTMTDSFRAVGRIVSQEYEAKAEEAIVREFSGIPVAEPRIGRMFLLDGSNILYWNQRNGVSLGCIRAIADYLKSQGEDFMVIFDATAPHLLKKNAPAEHAAYESWLLNDPEHFIQVPAGTCADVFLLEEAESNPEAIILTQDLYRDHKDDYPGILNRRERIASGMYLNGKIVFPKLKISIPLNHSDVPEMQQAV